MLTQKATTVSSKSTSRPTTTDELLKDLLKSQPAANITSEFKSTRAAKDDKFNLNNDDDSSDSGAESGNGAGDGVVDRYQPIKFNFTDHQMAKFLEKLEEERLDARIEHPSIDSSFIKGPFLAGGRYAAETYGTAMHRVKSQVLPELESFCKTFNLPMSYSCALIKKWSMDDAFIAVQAWTDLMSHFYHQHVVGEEFKEFNFSEELKGLRGLHNGKYKKDIDDLMALWPTRN